jgi:hypothetical protein
MEEAKGTKGNMERKKGITFQPSLTSHVFVYVIKERTPIDATSMFQ